MLKLLENFFRFAYQNTYEIDLSSIIFIKTKHKRYMCIYIIVYYE